MFSPEPTARRLNKSASDFKLARGPAPQTTKNMHRKNLTFLSSALPSSINSGHQHSHSVLETSYSQGVGKSAVQTLKSQIIRNVLKQGRKDKPSDRLFKELKWQGATDGRNSRTNCNGEELASSAQAWYNHSNKTAARDQEHKSAQQRRAEHYDSCLWGQPKSSEKQWGSTKKSRVSAVTDYRHPNGEDKKDNTTRDQDAFTAYVRNFQSSVLPRSPVMTSSTKVKQQRRFIADEINSAGKEPRKFNRNYSDIFGREFKHDPAKPSGTQRTTQYASSTNWTEARTEDAREKNSAVATAKAKMLHEYRSKQFDDPNRTYDIISNAEVIPKKQAQSIRERYEPDKTKQRELAGSLRIED